MAQLTASPEFLYNFITLDFGDQSVTDTIGQAITRRLDVVIALLLRLIQSDDRMLSTREQIFILSSLGLRPVEIAHILGKKTTYINKELSGLRKAGGK